MLHTTSRVKELSDMDILIGNFGSVDWCIPVSPSEFSPVYGRGRTLFNSVQLSNGPRPKVIT